MILVLAQPPSSSSGGLSNDAGQPKPRFGPNMSGMGRNFENMPEMGRNSERMSGMGRNSENMSKMGPPPHHLMAPNQP